MSVPPLELALDHGAGWLWQGPTAAGKADQKKKARAKKMGKAAKKMVKAGRQERHRYNTPLLGERWFEKDVNDGDLKVLLRKFCTDPHTPAQTGSLANDQTMKLMVDTISGLCNRLVTMSGECTNNTLDNYTKDKAGVVNFILALVYSLNNQTVGPLDESAYHRDFDRMFKESNDGCSVFKRLLTELNDAGDDVLEEVYPSVERDVDFHQTALVAYLPSLANLVAIAAVRVALIARMDEENFEEYKKRNCQYQPGVNFWADLTADVWSRVKKTQFCALGSVIAAWVEICGDEYKKGMHSPYDKRMEYMSDINKHVKPVAEDYTTGGKQEHWVTDEESDVEVAKTATRLIYSAFIESSSSDAGLYGTFWATGPYSE